MVSDAIKDCSRRRDIILDPFGGSGTTLIAAERNRVRHLIYLAFFAPDIIEQAINGALPLHITSDYLIRAGVPSDWNAQREILANVNARTVRG